ncbi:hypothetical protein JNUCC0626_49835 (plasmid) [Lentzea sp. JNUCC 0626]|uniref:hypothetical protein n=1 Tax=Lentzea sp. JNUCC 0626 TaxID=3367513 RepID=UPI00374855F9
MNPPAWAKDAQALMDLAVETDWSAQGAMREINGRILAFWQEHGDTNLLRTMCEWAEDARHHTGYEPRDGAAKPSFEPHDANGDPVPLDAVPAGQLWAARFVAAWFGKDVAEQQGLVDALRSQFTNEDYSAAILHTLRLTSEMVRTGQGVRDRPAPEPAWASQADALFDAAVADRWRGGDGVMSLLERFAAEHGTPAVIGAMKGWCRRVHHLVAADHVGKPAFPGWTSEAGEELTADDVPAGPRWAGRFVAAMWNDDGEQARALLASIRTSEQLTVNVIETLKATSGLVPGRS